jgi:hypothetical protein
MSDPAFGPCIHRSPPSKTHINRSGLSYLSFSLSSKIHTFLSLSKNVELRDTCSPLSTSENETGLGMPVFSWRHCSLSKNTADPSLMEDSKESICSAPCSLFLWSSKNVQHAAVMTSLLRFQKPTCTMACRVLSGDFAISSKINDEPWMWEIQKKCLIWAYVFLPPLEIQKTFRK